MQRFEGTLALFIIVLCLMKKAKVPSKRCIKICNVLRAL